MDNKDTEYFQSSQEILLDSTVVEYYILCEDGDWNNTLLFLPNTPERKEMKLRKKWRTEAEKLSRSKTIKKMPPGKIELLKFCLGRTLPRLKSFM